MNLLRGKRSFHFGLIVPDQIEAIPGNSADAVQNKDSLHTAIQNYIAAMKFGRNTVFNDSFVPARSTKSFVLYRENTYAEKLENHYIEDELTYSLLFIHYLIYKHKKN